MQWSQTATSSTDTCSGSWISSRARDAASEPTVTVRADLDLSEASGLMVRYGTTHVVVTERDDGTPIGILSSLDVAAAVGRQ